MDVLSYGIVCLDYIWRVSKLPPPGGGAGIRDEATLMGGEAVNTAFPLKCWGLEVGVVGNALGYDERGDKLRDLLAEAFSPEDVQCATIPDSITPFCTCIATDDGHRTMFGRGFNAAYPSLDPARLEGVRFFTIDAGGHREQGKEAAIMAAEAGAAVVAMDCEGVPEICQIADTLQISAEHLIFDGLEDTDEATRAWAVQKHEECGATVILTRGPKGCVVAARSGEVLHVPAYSLECVVDSTGSGDVFRAGYLYGRVQGWELLKTLQFASAAASFNCGQMGGCGGIATVEEILAKIAEDHPLTMKE